MSNLMGTVDTAMGEPIGTTGINGVPIATGNLNQSAAPDQTIIFQVDGETFGRLVYKYNEQTKQKYGVRLAEAVSIE